MGYQVLVSDGSVRGPGFLSGAQILSFRRTPSLYLSPVEQGRDYWVLNDCSPVLRTNTLGTCSMYGWMY